MDNSSSVNGILGSSCIEDANFFINTTDIAPENLDKFTKELTEVRRSLTNIFKEQTTLSIKIYSRVPSQGTVTTRHDTWTKKLQELALKIAECDFKVKNEQDKLPHFESNFAIIVHWEHLSKVQQSLYFITKRNEELQHITDSPVYQQALELYKKVISQCETLKNSYKTFSIEEFQKTFTETSLAITEQKKGITNINHKLKKEIKSLHRDTLNFILYTIASYTEEEYSFETSPKQNLMQNIQLFIGSLSENDNDLVAKLNKMSLKEELAASHEPLDYISKHENTPLSDERYFEMNAKVISPYYRYSSENYTHIETLQKNARCLQSVEHDLGALFETIWDSAYRDDTTVHTPAAEIELYQNVLKQLKSDLRIAQNGYLCTAKFSNEIPPIFDYCTSLLAWTKELQHTLDFLVEITSDTWIRVHTIKNDLLKFLSLSYSIAEKHPKSQWERIRHLYAAIQQLTLLPTPIEQTTYAGQWQIATIERIRTCLSVKKLQKLPITKLEKKLTKLLYRNLLIDGNDTFTIKSLLSRKITECLYFSHEICSPLVDLCSSILKNTISYKKAFTLIRSEDKEFNEILSAYETYTNHPQDDKLLKTYAEVFQLLAQIGSFIRKTEKPSELKYTALIYYTACQQHLSTFPTEASDSITAYRIKQLLPIVTEKLKELQTRYSFPDYCTQPQNDEEQIYKSLLYIFHAKHKDKNILWNLRKLLENDQVIVTREETKFLIEHLIITLFANDIPLTLTEEKRLVEAFKSYLENGTKWHAAFGIIHIEEMLYKYLYKHESKNGLSKHFFPEQCSPKRNEQQSHASWETVLSNYVACKELLKAHKSTIKQGSEEATQYTTYMKAMSKEIPKFKTHSEPFYLELFSDCYRQIESYSKKFTK